MTNQSAWLDLFEIIIRSVILNVDIFRMIVDDFMNEDITKDIQVDDSLTSSIIGPRGSRIGSVRKKTSAIIKIGTDNWMNMLLYNELRFNLLYW